MIDVSSLGLIAEGNKRACHRHPHDAGKCLKVALSDDGHADTAREDREYARLGIARLHGDVPLPRHFPPLETNRGPAAVRELVRDADGAVSATLLDELTPVTLARQPDGWRRALTSFTDWLWCHSVVATDMTPNNICVRYAEDGSPSFLLIDGLGHRDRWPLIEQFQTARRWKLRRHFVKRGLTDLPALLAVSEGHRRRRTG